jgi:uncharacterized protein (DUF2132 family)
MQFYLGASCNNPASFLMTHPRSSDPLHGVTLEMILLHLVERYGWEELGRAISIRCFQIDPSIKSSLTFLRRTPWARAKVEELYRRSVTREPG